MRPRLGLICVALACRSPGPDDAPSKGDDTATDTPITTDDGVEETDETDEPGPTDDPVESDIDTDAHSDIDTDDTGMGLPLCFPGPLSDGTACLSTVPARSWGPDWDYPSSADTRYSPPRRFLDLTQVDASARLSANFVLSEIAQAVKGRWALVQPHLVEHLQAVRDATGGPLFVNSGYRSPAYNRGVGGASFSRHQWGDAADVRSEAVDLLLLGSLCLDEGAGWVGYYETHVHCDWRDDPNDPVLFGAAFRSAGPRELPAERSARLVLGPPLTAPATGWDEGEPLRIWRFWDARGAELSTQRGASAQPPDGARRVKVEVGQEIVLEAELPSP